MKKKLWDVDAAEKFFKGYKFPKGVIKLDQCTHINNPKAFVAINLSMARHNNGIETFRPYWERLKALKRHLESNERRKKKTAG